MKEYKNISDIDTSTPEGDMLLTAIAIITCQPDYAHKTPDEVLQEIDKRTRETLSEWLAKHGK